MVSGNSSRSVIGLTDGVLARVEVFPSKMLLEEPMSKVVFAVALILAFDKP
jgi:hypothetical protein